MLRVVYPPTSNTAVHDHHEKINSWVSISFQYEYVAPLGGPLGYRSSAITMRRSIHGFPLLSYIGMVLHLTGRQSSAIKDGAYLC